MSPYGWSWVSSNIPTNTSAVTATAAYVIRVAKLVATWTLTTIFSLKMLLSIGTTLQIGCRSNVYNDPGKLFAIGSTSLGGD